MEYISTVLYMTRDGRQSVVINRLKKHRILMGYSQCEAARLIGLRSTPILSRWENGTALPSLENLFKLSIIYRTLTEELYRDLYLDIRHELEQQAKIVARKERSKQSEKHQ